jgi:hypothetical protein
VNWIAFILGAWLLVQTLRDIYRIDINAMREKFLKEHGKQEDPANEGAD